MTKPELLQKHLTIPQLAGAGLFEDIANHMRRGTPIVPPSHKFDEIETARYAGRMESWIIACEYLQKIHEMPVEPKQETVRNYQPPKSVEPQQS